MDFTVTGAIPAYDRAKDIVADIKDARPRGISYQYRLALLAI